jgi:hypothetical protein
MAMVDDDKFLPISPLPLVNTLEKDIDGSCSTFGEEEEEEQ